MIYKPKIVVAFWRACGLPAPMAEHCFCKGRKWRFDFAFQNFKRELCDENGCEVAILTSKSARRGGVAIEIQGGIWTRGRHTRGAALKLEWEKLNTAAILGWRILYCEPKDILTVKFAQTVRAALVNEKL